MVQLPILLLNKGQTVYAIITDDSSGEELARYALQDADILDCDIYAEKYADAIGFSIDESGGIVPNGLGDFTVTLQDEPGYVVCWNSQSYCMGAE